MTTMKYAISFLGLIIIMSCGQADTTSSNAKAESKIENPVTEKIANASTDIVKSVSTESKTTIEETTEKESLKEENQDPQTVSGNIENPNPVKVSQKIDKKSKVNKVKETIKEVEKPTVVDAPEAASTIVGTAKEAVKEAKKEMPQIEDTPAPEIVEAPEPEPKKVLAPVFSHESFNNLLKKHVSSSGKVNYNNFKADESKLDAYLKLLDENPPAAGWSKSKKMAYWINAYNAGTIKLILKNYPVKSITKLHGGKPWDQKWIPLGGKTYTLNNIENDILRPVYKDARIHFAVNCAAKSCPPLLNKAWTSGNLNSNLEKQTKAFINDPSQNTISADAIEISKIFEWYAVDFDDIITYFNKYSKVKINPGAKVTYKEYNWDLNK